jgi:hypothetical protein
MLSVTATSRSEHLLVADTLFYRGESCEENVLLPWGRGVSGGRRGPAVRSRTWRQKRTDIYVWV